MIIQVKIKNTDPFRINSAAEGRELSLFPFHGEKLKGYFSPKNRSGKPIDADSAWNLAGTTDFNSNDPIDKHNLAFIKDFMTEFATQYNFRDIIEIKDPSDEINRNITRNERLIEVNALIHKMRTENDDESIRNLFRRVIGNPRERDVLMLLNDLLNKAVENPELFYYDGKLITEHEIYHLQIMVDTLVEKGFFKQDGVGGIFRKSIKFANGVNDAIIKMQSDSTLMKEAKEFLNNPNALLPVQEVAEMDSVYKELLGNESSAIPEHLIPVEDLSFNTVTGEEDRDALYKFAEQHFDKLLADKYIVKDGVGGGTKYSPYDNPSVKLNKVGLLNYFADNEGVIKQLVSLIERG